MSGKGSAARGTHRDSPIWCAAPSSINRIVSSADPLTHSLYIVYMMDGDGNPQAHKIHAINSRFFIYANRGKFLKNRRFRFHFFKFFSFRCVHHDPCVTPRPKIKQKLRGSVSLGESPHPRLGRAAASELLG